MTLMKALVIEGAILTIAIALGLAESAENTQVAWRVTNYQPMTLNIGDSIQFVNSGYHNAIIMKSESHMENCNFAESKLLSPQIYTNEGNEETVYFSCSIGRHCNWGQKLAVTFVAPPESSSPTIDNEEEPSDPFNATMIPSMAPTCANTEPFMNLRGSMRDCEWLMSDPDKMQVRCDRFGENCPAACGMC